MVIRLVTYNVHGCRGADFRILADRPLDVLSKLEADCIALQEFVDAPLPNGRGLLAHWACELGTNAIYAPAFVRGGETFGNALLTRFKILARREHDISIVGYRRRILLDATLDAGSATLQVLVMHLGVSPWERARQTAALRALILQPSADVQVCVGDLNEPRRTGVISRTLGHTFRSSPPLATFPASAPLLALDSVWVRPKECLVNSSVDRSRAARRASDHLPLVVTIRLPARSHPAIPQTP